MRILLLTTYFRPDIASTGVIMSKLADEFVARGHQLSVLTSVPHYDTNRIWPEYTGKLIRAERSDSMQVFRLYTHVAKNKASVPQRLLSYGAFSLLSLLKGMVLPKHDVILAPSPPLSNGVVADFLSRLSGTPFVYNVQDIWPDVAIRAGVLKDGRTIRRLKKMEEYVYRRASGITVISEGFRRNLLSKGVPDTKLSTIPNFVDIEFITPRPKENPFSKRYSLQEKFVVLFAGNMGFSQGLETVLDAAALLKEIPAVEFLMVGNGASRSRVETYLGNLGLNNVRFLPYQSHEDLPAMYGSADVCLIPLRRGFTAESVPCKLFSIMAAGKPAIAAVDPGSETWALLQRARGGACVEPEDAGGLADAILWYYRNPDARLDAGKNARKFVETEFRPEVIAERYLNALKMAIGPIPGRTTGPSLNSIGGKSATGAKQEQR
jgi:colanic acid biosynthesis glycosyl transferase WcaI